MKYIETVARLVTTAKTRFENGKVGLAQVRKRGEWGMYRFMDIKDMPLKEVYRVEVDENGASLWHYETLTCEVEKDSSGQYSLTYVYGESRSDADSIETFLYEFNINQYSFGFKSVNGGFYCWTDNEFIYLENFKDSEAFTQELKEKEVK